MTLDELEALDALPATAKPVAQIKAAQSITPADVAALEASPGPVPGGSITPDQLQALDAPEAVAPSPVPVQSPATPEAAAPAIDQRYDLQGQIGGAILTGAAKSIYQTSDFIFGAPREADKSETRRGIEAFDKELGDAHIANSFVSGLSQFAVGMLGAGKLISAARAVPGVAGAAASVGRVGGAILEGAGGGASASLGAGSAVGAQFGRAAASAAPESLKAAVVGAVAFDPSGERLSNLVEKFPALQNPVTGFLAAQPGDTRAMGRIKNAFESIGVDAALAGVFAASVAGFKAIRSGDQAAIAATQQDLAAAIAHKDAKLATTKGDLETVERLREDHPEAVAQAEQAVDAHEVRTAGAETVLPQQEVTLGQSDGGPVRPEGLGPVPETNYRRSLSDHTAVVYHETSAQGVADWLPNDQRQQSGVAGKRERYYSNNPDLALGQGDNTGFRLELDTSGLEGRINQAKPTWQHSWEGGDAEFTARVGRDVDDATLLRAVTVMPDQFEGTGTPWQRRARSKLEELTAKDGWTRTDNPDGSVTYRRPEAPLPVQAKDVAQQAVSAEQQAQGATVQRVDSPTQGAGAEGLPPKPTLPGISDEQLTAFIKQGQDDTAALLGPGGWEGALERGYTFGNGGSIPWQKLARVSETGPDPLDFMVSRLADTFQADIAKAKGGDAQGVMHDAQVDRITGQLANLWNEDPQAFLGQMQLAGKASQNMAARMEAGLLVATRVMQDALNTRSRIGLGMLEQWGGDMKAARADLEDQLQVAASVWSQTMAIRASSGRTMRRGRSEFQLSLEDVAAMKGLDDVKFFGLLDTVGHDFQVANRLIKPGFWSRLKDDAAYLYVNNLLWGLRTHFVNTLTNTYMLTSRPMERILGSAILGDMQGVRQNWSQYGYMASAIHEGWRDAVKAWQIGDSIMSPTRWRSARPASRTTVAAPTGWPRATSSGTRCPTSCPTPTRA